MSWTNPVIWHEGMFLRSQHFQQHSRWTEAFVRARTRALGPWWWGMVEMAIDQEKLKIGQFALAEATGVFQDGTPFLIAGDNGDTDPPEALMLDEGARRKIVHLCLPDPLHAASQVSHDMPGATGRYRVQSFAARDTFPLAPEDDTDEAAMLQIGRLRLRLMLDSDDRNGWLSIPIARIEEVGADKRVRLDDEWIVPCVRIGAAPKLVSFVDEVLGHLTSRIADLATPLAGTLPQTPLHMLDFMRLQAANRWQKLLAHWAAAKAVHPEQLYATFVQMAGEFATFSTEAHKLDGYPAGYVHEDLQRSFVRVIADLRRSLAWMRDSGTELIQLQQRANWYRGRVYKKELLTSALFYLVVKSDQPTEVLRREFPAQVKVGAMRQLDAMVNSAVPSIGVSPMAAPPPQLIVPPGSVCFELDRTSPYWEQIRATAEFGLHVSDALRNVTLELWAVRP